MGRAHWPTRTSDTSPPPGSGSLHGQQNPAVMRAPRPSTSRECSRASSSAGESATDTVNPASSHHSRGPFGGEHSHRTDNRLLLRPDIHTLFDTPHLTVALDPARGYVTR